ncbi:biopolymer transporter ExbD [Gammaproteobacteria bacterium]|nr:biopolymer transporter ExbD [Gammaproteobacteria bacterium]|tara:strand:- start:52 stop:468 length:417 start_codon:yes stop_codon:yes gene_type:complete
MKRVRSKQEVTLELVPLIDVVFLLLIFFMVSTTFVQDSRINLSLPEAHGDLSSEIEVSAIALAVDKDGLYTINGVALKTNDRPTIVEALLKITEPGDAKQKIVLLADAKTDYQNVIVALDALSSVGLSNVSMKTVIPQ